MWPCARTPKVTPTSLLLGRPLLPQRNSIAPPQSSNIIVTLVSALPMCMMGI
jgi:hypothetical protein